MVADYDRGLEPELGHEALGSGVNVGGKAPQSHKVPANQGAGSCARSCSEPDRSTGCGASIERHTF